MIKLLEEKLEDKKLINLIRKILINGQNKTAIGMPLGNLTSQFFANIYLNKFDYFVKHKLKARYYIRYVDDFVILHNSKSQLEEWKHKINEFLKKELILELHTDKSKITTLSRGIDFVGFRNFHYFKLLRKRNIKNMEIKIKIFNEGLIPKEKLLESFQGWQAYAKWADSYNLVNNFNKMITP